MPIQVTCPGCLKRFQVNEKFAGKTGPCPNCSKPIKIPDKADEVVIHAPESEGPKDSKGRPVFKPIRRREVKLSLPVILGIAVAAMLCLAVALIVRLTTDEPPTALLALGAILLAPPLAFGGYWFLHDDELESFVGNELLVRTGICAAAFLATWGIYLFIPSYLNGYHSMAEFSSLDLAIVVPIMLIVGAVASLYAFELELGQAIMHYMLYFAVTFVLAATAGTELARPLANPDRNPAGRQPSAVQAPPPAASTPSPAQPATNPPATNPPAAGVKPPAQPANPPPAKDKPSSRLLQ
jgi:hypothetical protein